MCLDNFCYQLDEIKKNFDVLTLGAALNFFNKHGKFPRETVVLTIDDGYDDFYKYAYHELIKRNIGATLFVSVNFIDGKLWLWPDRIEYAINKTKIKNYSFEYFGGKKILTFDSSQNKQYAWSILIDYCTNVNNDERLNFINNFEKILEVNVPIKCDDSYNHVTWEQLVEMQSFGIEIGSHTMNHPILSKVSPGFLDEEINTSRQILTKKLGKPVVSFCYPNSRVNDLNNLVVEKVREAGYLGAVLCQNAPFTDEFRLARLGLTHDKVDFLWKLYGGENIAYKLGQRC
jgi:peptidoglycan/xylan/chitin deacetylase (PgdA/CDA1 family)